MTSDSLAKEASSGIAHGGIAGRPAGPARQEGRPEAGLRSRLHRQMDEEGRGRRDPGRRHPNVGRDAGQTVRAGPVRPADGLAGAGCGRQGRHHQARDVGRQPAGRAMSTVSRGRPARSWTTIICGATSRPCRTRSHRDLQPFLLRRSRWSCACIPSSSPARSSRRRSRTRVSGSGASRRSTPSRSTWSHNGIVVVKFFLNVSREAQKERFLERVD